MAEAEEKPILFVDVDGVISLFGFESIDDPPGRFHWIDGIAHCIKLEAGPLLRELEELFEMVWATGWEEKANEYLPGILELESKWPTLGFDGQAVFGSAHWKLGQIDQYAGDRPAAWIDDNLDDECIEWAKERRAPTMLVLTETADGITSEHVEQLLDFAHELEQEY